MGVKMTALPISIELNDEYGVIIRCSDKNLADELDDFLTENYYILYEFNLSEPGTTLFYFGKASSLENVQAIYGVFEKSKEIP